MINLGGGVITDMGGFVASTYKRGIDFVQVPTTLLSQVDASVGGKTGVDMDAVKNIIGTFTQPKAVFMYNDFLKTLPQRQILSGLAEMLKHGLIRR
jgi:3-dehydroquinate synthase